MVMRDIMSFGIIISILVINGLKNEAMRPKKIITYIFRPHFYLSHSHSSVLFKPFSPTPEEYSENHGFPVISFADRRWVGSYASIPRRSLRNVSCWLSRRCGQWSRTRDASGRLG